MHPGTNPRAEDIPEGEGHGQTEPQCPRACLGPGVQASPVLQGGSVVLTEVGMDPIIPGDWDAVDAGSLADSTSSQQLRAPSSLFAQMGEMRHIRPISQAKGLENQAVQPTKGKVWVVQSGYWRKSVLGSPCRLNAISAGPTFS